MVDHEHEAVGVVGAGDDLDIPSQRMAHDASFGEGTRHEFSVRVVVERRCHIDGTPIAEHVRGHCRLPRELPVGELRHDRGRGHPHDLRPYRARRSVAERNRAVRIERKELFGPGAQEFGESAGRGGLRDIHSQSEFIVGQSGEKRHHHVAATGHVVGQRLCVDVSDAVERGDDHERIAGQVCAGGNEVDGHPGGSKSRICPMGLRHVFHVLGRMCVVLNRPPCFPAEHDRCACVDPTATDGRELVEHGADSERLSPDSGVGAGVGEQSGVEFLRALARRPPLEEADTVGAAGDM